MCMGRGFCFMCVGTGGGEGGGVESLKVLIKTINCENSSGEMVLF